MYCYDSTMSAHLTNGLIVTSCALYDLLIDDISGTNLCIEPE